MKLQDLANLTTLYNEPHRYYHNLNHIHECLAALEEYQKDTNDYQNSDLITTAIWWHDAIYNPYSANNEINSARLYDASVDSLERGWSYNDWIKDVIGRTAKHLEDQTFHYETDSWDIAAQLVLDIDLHSMGKSYEVFEKNGKNIRKEYANVSADVFYPNRIKFLENILLRKSLFYTDYFKNKYEESARKNILENLIISINRHNKKP